MNVASALELFEHGDPELRALFGARSDAEHPISTIRDVKRYLNGVACTLPLIGHEVHAGDFAVLEMLRIFFPSVHDALYEIRSIVTRYELREPDARKERHAAIKALVDASQQVPKVEYAVKLLCKVFPQVQEALRPMNYVYGANSGWERERRAASPLHIDKYFQLRVPDDAILRKDVVDLVEKVVAVAPNARTTFLLDQFRAYGSRLGALFSELRLGATATPSAFEDALWPALASISSTFDAPANADPQNDGALNGAAFLLFEKVATRQPKDQTSIVKDVVNTATSDLFASYLVYLGVQDGGDQGPVLPKADWSDIRAALSTRLAKNLAGTDVTTRFPRWWNVILRGWGDFQAVARYLGVCFTARPATLLTVARRCVADETSTAAFVTIPEIARYADLTVLAECSAEAVAPIGPPRERALVEAFLAEVRLVPALASELEAMRTECSELATVTIGDSWKRLVPSEWQQNAARLRKCFASRPWWSRLEAVYPELDSIYTELDSASVAMTSPEAAADALAAKASITSRATQLGAALDALIPDVRSVTGKQVPRDFSW